MPIPMESFIHQLFTNPTFLIIVLLTTGVILVNGWTDAPNAIATCVATRSLTTNKAVLMAAIFNFLGVMVMTMVSAKVAQTIYTMVDFRGDARLSLIALCAGTFAILLWSTTAWRYGIPTSEGHALIAGISGAAIALQGGLSGINGSQWVKVLYGLVLSLLAGLAGGYAIARFIQRLFRHMERRQATAFFVKAQISASAAMAFMHGAQDGQKLIGVLLLGMFLAQGDSSTTEFAIPIWLILYCSVVMTLGTAIGGQRIIKKVGLDMVKLEPYQGFSADAAATLSLLLSSALGFPVSTTHTKTTAIMGVGLARRVSYVKWNIVREMVLAWLLTFPGCGLVGYLITFVFLRIFS